MQDYGTIDCAVWEHPAFRTLSRDARLLFAYLKTCRQGNGAGLFSIGLGAMEDGTGIERDELRAALVELSCGHVALRDGRLEPVDNSVDNSPNLAFTLYDEACQVVYLPGHMRFFKPAGRNRVVHCIKVITETPGAFRWRDAAICNLEENHNLTSAEWQSLKPLRSPLQAPSKPLRSPSVLSNDNSVPVENSEVDSKGRSEIDRTGWSKNDHSGLDPGPGAEPVNGQTFKPLAVFRFDGETIAVPPQHQDHDKLRMKLAQRFGVGTRGKTREDITSRLIRAIEGAGGERR